MLDVECPFCGYAEAVDVNPELEYRCDHCGTVFAIPDSQKQLAQNRNDQIQREKKRKQNSRFRAERRKREELQAMEQLRQRANSVMVSTTPSLDGWTVETYLGIESVEVVLGTGLFSEFTTEIQDFFGARSTAFEQKLQAAKQATFDKLKYCAASKGGNAVIGIDLDYTEFSGNRIGLIVSGTVVRVVNSRAD